MTDPEILALWLYLQATWPQFPVPDRAELRHVKLVVWRDSLGDLDANLVRMAVVALGNRDHPPRPGQLRAAAADLAQQQAGLPAVPDPDQALAEVLAGVAAFGRARQPTWSHQAVAATVRAMGWGAICDSTDPGVLRGQWHRLYELAASRAHREQLPPPPALAGLPGALRRLDDALQEHNPRRTDG